MKKFIKRVIVLLLVIAQLLPVYQIPAARAADKIDSKIRFNDFYGEVKIRPDAEEDDSYEFVDLDTVIYEGDRIKTEEDSGAILGLEDMSTYVIKPESTLIIHTDEGNVSKIEMLAGSMWGNIKKISEGKSLEIEMSQCVCGITGTTIYAETSGPDQQDQEEQKQEKEKKQEEEKKNSKNIESIIQNEIDKNNSEGVSPALNDAIQNILTINLGLKKSFDDKATWPSEEVKENKNINVIEVSQLQSNDPILKESQLQTFDQINTERPQLITLDQKQEEDQVFQMPQLQTFDQVYEQQTEMEKVLASLPKVEPIELKFSSKELEALHNVFNKNNNNNNNNNNKGGKLSEEEQKKQVEEKKRQEEEKKRQEELKKQQEEEKKKQEEEQKQQAQQEKQDLVQQRKQAQQNNNTEQNNNSTNKVKTIKKFNNSNDKKVVVKKVKKLKNNGFKRKIRKAGSKSDIVKVTKGTAKIKNLANGETVMVPAGYQATINGNIVDVKPIENLENLQNELNQQLDRANDKQSTQQLIEKLNGQTGQINDAKKSLDDMLNTAKKIVESNIPSDKLKSAFSIYNKAVEDGKRFVSIFVEINSTISVLNKRLSSKAENTVVVTKEEAEAADEAIKKANSAMNNFSQSLDALVAFADKIEEKLGFNPLNSLTSQAEKAKEIKDAIEAASKELDEDIVKGITDESSYSDFKDAVARCEALLKDLQRTSQNIKADEVGRDLADALKKQYEIVSDRIEKVMKDYSSVPEVKSATLSQMNDFEMKVPGFSSDIRKYLSEYNAIERSSTDAKKRYVESVTRTLASYDRMRRVYTKANRMYTQMEKEFKQSKFKTSEYNDVKESWEKIEKAMTEIDSEASELSSCVENLKSQLERLLGQ